MARELSATRATAEVATQNRKGGDTMLPLPERTRGEGAIRKAHSGIVPGINSEVDVRAEPCG